MPIFYFNIIILFNDHFFPVIALMKFQTELKMLSKEDVMLNNFPTIKMIYSGVNPAGGGLSIGPAGCCPGLILLCESVSVFGVVVVDDESLSESFG